MMIDNKEQDHKVDSKEKKKFVPTKHPRPWEIELTEEQRKNLRKQLEEDTKRYRELGKRMAKDRTCLKVAALSRHFLLNWKIFNLIFILFLAIT